MSAWLPWWLPWAEVAYSGPACLICCLLFIVLFLIPLPNGCKCFLYLNTASLFSLAVCQGLIAEWTERNEKNIGPNELFYFPLIFAHQIFYYGSTASLFFLTCERLFLCYHPTFYEYHKWRLLPCLLGAIMLVSLIALPFTIMLQYSEQLFISSFHFKIAGQTQPIAVMLTTIADFITLMLLLVCYRQSRFYYRTQFAKVNLNIRYQAKEVIELTRVLIPIGCSSLALKFLVEMLATFVFTDPALIGTSVLVLRFVSTMAYVEPILLMFRHRSISRKVIIVLTLGRIQSQTETTIISTEDTTSSYFDALRRDWK